MESDSKRHDGAADKGGDEALPAKIAPPETDRVVTEPPMGSPAKDGGDGEKAATDVRGNEEPPVAGPKSQLMTFALSEHAVLLARIGSSKFLLYAFKSASDGRELSVQFADGTTAHAGITLAPLAEKTCHVFCGQLSQDKGVPRVVVAVYVTGRNQSVLLAPVDNPEAPYSVKFDSKWLTEPRESKVFDSQRAMDDFVSTALLAHATSVAALRAKEAGEVTPVSAPKTKPRSRVSDADSPADGAGAVVTVDRNQLESLKEKANSFGSLSAELNGVLSAVKKTASGTSASLTTLTNTANEILKAVNRLGTATTPGSAGATTTAVVDDAVVKAVTAKLVLQVQESVAAAELRIMQHMDAQMVKLTASIEAARHGASSMPPPPQVAYYPQYGTPHVLVHHQYPPGSSAPAPQQQGAIMYATHAQIAPPGHPSGPPNHPGTAQWIPYYGANAPGHVGFQ